MEASPIEVQKALKGMDYPAKKQDLIKKAKDNDAPQKVMHVLENLPDKEFESAVDVSKEFKGEGQEGHGKKEAEAARSIPVEVAIKVDMHRRKVAEKVMEAEEAIAKKIKLQK